MSRPAVCLVSALTILSLAACQPAAQSADTASSSETVPALASADPQNLSSDRYMDDRSTAEQVVLSLYNALSRQEYLRAYSYYEPAVLPPYDSWAAGYEGSRDFTVLMGKVTSDAGAGNLYWHVPVAMRATNKAGQVEVFSGCYVLHQVQPAVQGTPPFRPLGIRSGTLKPSTLPLEQSVPASCE